MRTVGDVLEYYQAEPKMLSYFKSLDVSSLAGNVSFNVRREKALGVRDNAIKVPHCRVVLGYMAGPGAVAQGSDRSLNNLIVEELI